MRILSLSLPPSIPPRTVVEKGSLTLGGTTTGWRFAVLQLQNLLAELMDRFEFVEPVGGPGVVRGALFASSLG